MRVKEKLLCSCNSSKSLRSNKMLPAKQSVSSEASDESSESKNIENGEGNNSPDGSNFCGVEGWKDAAIDPVLGFFHAQGNTAELAPAVSVSENEIHQQLQNYKDFGNLDDLYLDVVSPPFQSCEEEISQIFGIDSLQGSELVKSKPKGGSYVLPMASLEILRQHGSKRLRLDREKSSAGSQIQSNDHRRSSTLSTEGIIELAAEKFIQSMSMSKEVSIISHPYAISVLGLSEDDAKGVELVQNLLLCAEEVRDKKYERANRLLEECDKMSSCTGTPIQRLVFYFTEALYEKIDREMGTLTPKGLGKKIADHRESLKWTNTFLLSFQKWHPTSQITKFSGIQAVVDHVKEASKVHVIDLEIRSGVQHTILMHALASRPEHPVEHLKITAIGTESRSTIDETRKRLMTIAESLNLKLSFHIVMVADILDLNVKLFELDDDEAVAVYANYTLTNMIGRADGLEHVMRVIKNINPCVMIVTELEANCNSPDFVQRFVEALFFYGTFFDSMAECMKNDEKNRRDAESTCFSSSIRNIVAAEGGERTIRHVGIKVWREFFARFGLVETKLSMSSVYQANLIRQSFHCANSCTLGMNGECLTIGWKGTPLCTLSAWKF